MNAIQFRTTSIPVVSDSHGKKWVSVRHVCEALGIRNNGQQEKLKSSQEFTCLDICTTGSDGKNYSMFCISADHAHLWVAGISSAKVSPDIREQFIAYKHECANVLRDHFTGRGGDFLGIAQQMQRIEQKIGNLAGVADTVFGDEKDEITHLVQAVADKHKVDGRTVWGWVQTNCDVGSYKKQNLKVKNYLKNLLGEGLRIVKE